MGKRIGIDLGTTNSVVAVMQGPAPEIQDSREGKPASRSAVGLLRRRARTGEASEEVLVGDIAIDNWASAPKDTIVSIKRLMGRSIDDPEVQNVRRWFAYEIVEPSDGTRDSVRVVMGGREYSPVDISAMILRKLKEDAEFRLGEEVTDAVITVPAYFSQAQKAATRLAGLKAGLRVLKILDEPTAAAVAYNLDQTAGEEAKTVLVYDLGGGTFDISVLMMSGSVFVTLDREGDMWLGGDNFDQAVVDFAVDQIKRDYEIDPTSDLKFMVALKLEAQKAKERLSTIKGSVDMILSGQLKDADGLPVDVCVSLGRAKYEELIRPMVERSLRLVDTALENAHLTMVDVDFVLMAGNATMTPLIQQAVEEKFGSRRVMRKKHPKHCVAEGAAIVARLLPESVVCTCGHENPGTSKTCDECGAKLELSGKSCPSCGLLNSANAPVCATCGTRVPGIEGSIATFDYGVQVAGDRLSVFIKKNDAVPSPLVWKTFRTQLPNQRILRIPVYAGGNFEKASANEKQGEAVTILPPGLPQDAGVRIGLGLDSNEIFELKATLEDGTDLDPWIVKGDLDARVIELLTEIDGQLRKLADLVRADEAERFEGLRDEVLESMRKSDFDGAKKIVARMQQLVDEIEKESAGGDGGPVSLEKKARGLIGFTQSILNEYGWAFDPAKVLSLTELVGRLETALDAHDDARILPAFTALDKATDDLPMVVQLLRGMRVAIMTRLQRRDPEQAQKLLDELDGIESALRDEPARGPMLLSGFSARLTSILEKLPPEGQPPLTVCPVCNRSLQGERVCPGCHNDTYLAKEATAITTSRH